MSCVFRNPDGQCLCLSPDKMTIGKKHPTLISPQVTPFAHGRTTLSDEFQSGFLYFF